MKRACVLIVEDNPVTRRGLVELIGREEGMRVCAEADDVASALNAIAEHKPDLMTVEIALRQMSGLELVKRVHADHPHLAILVVSAIDDLLYAVRMLGFGARGYVMNREPCETLATALREAIAGRIHVSQRVSDALLKRTVEGVKGGQLLDSLSDRELEVLHLIGHGLGTKQIAHRLTISIKTVETHRMHIKAKLGL